ncbi:MAG: WYL domain-containing protein [Burkholderiaceae bacterium]|nr:WYL domain-containing protein [Microbacteriaceae bacterium]
MSDVPPPAPRVPVEERLFSLVLALLASDGGLTKADILSTVQGYRQRFSVRGDNTNLERQFERDKDDIRDLGVPLEVMQDEDSPGSNQSLRYRIPRGSYELPADVKFSAEESALLSLAAVVWREGSLSSESKRALLKLRSLGGAAEVPVLGYAPRLRVRDAAFDPLSSALEKQSIVRFSYLKPGETDARVRTVVPLALVQHQGRWHLSAIETDSGARKTFLLRRIVSRVAPTGRTQAPPEGDHSAVALRGLDEVWVAHAAAVEVEPESDADSRLSARPGSIRSASGTLELHYSDLNIVADELAAFGPEVLVLAPAELRDAVRSRLEAVAVDHAVDNAIDHARDHAPHQGAHHG